MLAELDEGLRSLPQTAGTFRISRLLEDTHAKNNYWRASVETVARLLGAWPHNQSRRGESTWVNPHYIHERALGPADVKSRVAEMERCAAVGVLKHADVAPRFDLSPIGLKRWASRRNFDWSHKRRRGERQLARTIATVTEWFGCSRSSLVDNLPVSRQTMYFWVREHVRESDWSVPDDPAHAGGFDS